MQDNQDARRILLHVVHADFFEKQNFMYERLPSAGRRHERTRNGNPL